jgi:hypothetical protein
LNVADVAFKCCEIPSPCCMQYGLMLRRDFFLIFFFCATVAHLTPTVDLTAMRPSGGPRPSRPYIYKMSTSTGNTSFSCFQFSFFITSSDFLLHRLLFFFLIRRRICSSHVRAGSRKPCICNRLGDNHTLIADLGVSRQLNPLLRSARADRAAT